MKKTSVQLCLVMFILLLTQTASAVPFTVECSFMFDGHPEILSPRYLPAKTWTFDLRPKGFDPDTYDIISATLTLGLSDDGGWTKGDPKGEEEYALLGAEKDRFGPWEVDGYYKAAGAHSFALNKALDYLSDYGTLPVTLRTVALGYGRRGDVIGTLHSTGLSWSWRQNLSQCRNPPPCFFLALVL